MNISHFTLVALSILPVWAGEDKWIFRKTFISVGVGSSGGQSSSIQGVHYSAGSASSTAECCAHWEPCQGLCQECWASATGIPSPRILLSFFLQWRSRGNLGWSAWHWEQVAGQLVRYSLAYQLHRALCLPPPWGHGRPEHCRVIEDLWVPSPHLDVTKMKHWKIVLH